MVMCYSGIDQVLREAAGTFSLLHERITDTAIHKRLKACVPWVKAVLSKMMGADADKLIKGGLRFVVIDGSTVQGPGAKETWYRLHIAVDLVKLNLIHVEVTDKYVGESLDHYPLIEGDVAVVDRGYNQPGSLIEQSKKGVLFVLRYNAHGMNLYDEQGNKINWYEKLKTSTEDSLCVPVQIRKNGEFVEAFLHARRLPPEQWEEARRRVRKSAQSQGRTPSASALFLSEWVLVLTTVPEKVMDTHTVTELYRVRWQVELCIKRLKSLLNIDHLRAREGGQLAELYLHGKLLYSWVVEKKARRRFGDKWTRLDQKCCRTATWWRYWDLVKQEVAIMINGVLSWKESQWDVCFEVMQERPRKRKLQTLPDRVNNLIAACQTAELSNV